jgi:hypothetical protein
MATVAGFGGLMQVVAQVTEVVEALLQFHIS